MKTIYTCSSGQTVYDVAINIDTNLNGIIKLLQSSNIDSINDSDLNQKVVNYDTDLVADKILYSHIFGKRKRFNTGKDIYSLIAIYLLGTELNDYLTTEDGYKLQI